LKEKVAAPVYKAENTAVGIRHADHMVPFYPQKLALTSQKSGGRWIGIVLLRTQATGIHVHTNNVKGNRNDDALHYAIVSISLSIHVSQFPIIPSTPFPKHLQSVLLSMLNIEYLSKEALNGSDYTCLTPLTQGRKQINFEKRCIPLFSLEYWTMDKIEEPKNPDCFQIFRMIFVA
jgi:hypothetical protein